MPDYRRWRVDGATYFFTVVSFARRPIFRAESARASLREAIQDVSAKFPLLLDSIVLLPDHLHCLWTMPPGDVDYPLRWRQIKSEFTRSYLKANSRSPAMRLSRPARRERSVWQPRYWEHTCRDEDEVSRCRDYLHYNPVKHGLVARVRDYPWSTFHRYVGLGEYDLDWGSAEPTSWRPPDEWD